MLLQYDKDFSLYYLWIEYLTEPTAVSEDDNRLVDTNHIAGKSDTALDIRL